MLLWPMTVYSLGDMFTNTAVIIAKAMSISVILTGGRLFLNAKDKCRNKFIHGPHCGPRVLILCEVFRTHIP